MPQGFFNPENPALFRHFQGRFLFALPGVHGKSQGNDPVGDSLTEVFTQHGVVEEGIGGVRGDHEESVEEDDPGYGLLVGSLLDGGTATRIFLIICFLQIVFSPAARTPVPRRTTGRSDLRFTNQRFFDPLLMRCVSQS